MADFFRMHGFHPDQIVVHCPCIHACIEQDREEAGDGKRYQGIREQEAASVPAAGQARVQ